jgi:ribosomal protein S12 methylthiotransferase accessory factor
MDKRFWTGTHRCRDPEQTLAAIMPLLPGFGITRLADLTGLDCLGVPVAAAYRPAAATLSAAQGKGATLAAAKVSAAMEAIETWHAEAAVPAPAETAPAAALDLGYQVTELTEAPGSLVTEQTVLDWIEARTVTGRPALVPAALVRLGRRTRRDWRLDMITASSNGLASGNTRAEAIAHGLHELIERDACAALPAIPEAERVTLDLGTVPPGWCTDMTARIRDGGGQLHVTAVPSRFAVPCFAAWLRAEDTPWLAGGAGAHSDPAVALSRAVTEAAQSRLTVIAGSRDDLSPALYRQPWEPPPPLPEPGTVAGWAEITAGLGWSCGTDEDEAAEAARRITAVTGAEPMVVDLAAEAEFAVVKVLCPRLRFRRASPLPHPRTAAG